MADNAQPPVRNPSGQTTDTPTGPFADCGNGNPAFYHQFFDDFDNALSATGLYTVTTVNGGTVAHTPGDGGMALFTTGAAAGNFVEIQLPAASFLPAPPQKMFYEVRMQVANITTSAWVAGLMNTNATPFTGGITDGIYFSKAAASTTINLIVVKASVVSATIPVPVGAIATYANATNFDLGWYLNRHGDVQVFAGNQLVGYFPQSGTGTASPPLTGGTVARTLPSPPAAAPVVLPIVALNMTLAVSNGATAAATTLSADFHCASKER